jgi:hypothetical protein
MEELLGPTDPVGPVDVAIEVCRAWLAEHPADDNESVSTAWLVSLGFISVAGADDDEMYTVYDGHGGPALTLESDDQRCWMAMLGDADGDVWPCDIHVRAQVPDRPVAHERVDLGLAERQERHRVGDAHEPVRGQFDAAGCEGVG